MPHPARPTVTLRDVARAAGVSVATASRVLGGSSRTVTPENAQRVLAAAEAMRYSADASARAMRRVSDSIALIADDLTTPSIGMVVAAMEREASTAGAFVTVSSSYASPQRQLETVRVLRALRPRALVLTSGRIDAAAAAGRLLAELRAHQHDGGRVVIVGDTDLPFDSIGFDNHGSARALGVEVARAGHRRATVLAGSLDQAATAARTAGFTEGLQAGGVEAGQIRVVPCQVSRQGGFDAAQQLAADGLAGTEVVLAANDLIAIGALAGLHAAAVAVPADVSVTGFDDIPLAMDVTPRLTTVALPLGQAGAQAIRLAVEPGEQAGPPPRRITLRGRVVVRDSLAGVTGAPGPGRSGRPQRDPGGSRPVR